MVHRKVCVCVCVSLHVCKENLTDNGLNQLFNTETKSNREIYVIYVLRGIVLHFRNKCVIPRLVDKLIPLY